MKRDCRVYLRDILQAFRNAREFVGPRKGTKEGLELDADYAD